MCSLPREILDIVYDYVLSMQAYEKALWCKFHKENLTIIIHNGFERHGDFMAPLERAEYKKRETITLDPKDIPVFIDLIMDPSHWFAHIFDRELAAGYRSFSVRQHSVGLNHTAMAIHDYTYSASSDCRYLVEDWMVYTNRQSLYYPSILTRDCKLTSRARARDLVWHNRDIQDKINGYVAQMYLADLSQSIDGMIIVNLKPFSFIHYLTGLLSVFDYPTEHARGLLVGFPRAAYGGIRELIHPWDQPTIMLRLLETRRVTVYNDCIHFGYHGNSHSDEVIWLDDSDCGRYFVSHLYDYVGWL